MILLLVTLALLHSRIPSLVDVCSILHVYRPVGLLIRGHCYCCYLSF